MNKTAIKNFAIWARNKLIADISYRAGLMGITADGIHTALPQSTGQTEFYDIGTAEPYAITGEAIRQRKHLVELIQRKEKETDYKTAYKYIIEEVAYTWFNRLIAVRFMEVNDYLPSHIRVLSSDTGKLEPDLVTTPFDAELEYTRDEQQTVIDLKNENKLDEVFRLLFIKQCNALNGILPALFEKTNDYTELLLNLSVIDQDGVVYHLVHDIPEEDFDVERGGQVEIIGWLYQYYNTEPKDETFALLKRSIKVTKERLPAATQLFTPDWIVRYMVENSLGRLWLEGHPNDDLKAGWKYYLEEADQGPEVQAQLAGIRAEYALLNPEHVKVIDPCMGSGHILVYAFDVLMQIYESAGYGQRDAARSILEKNIYGLDIDDRAFQMAYFAIMMKARQYNRRILNGEYKTNVYSIQDSNGINRNQLQYFGAGLNEFEKNDAVTQMTGLLDTFKDAKEYGSILTVDQYDWDLLDRFVSNTEEIGQLSMYTIGLEETTDQLNQMIAQGRVLAQKYHVTITNPPYMGSSNMGKALSDYVKKYYPKTKYDLSTVFMEKALNMCKINGYVSMINIPVWMFLSSFEKMRKEYLRLGSFINMAHFGRGVFGSDFGTTSFCVKRGVIDNYLGLYLKLYDRQGEVESLDTKEEKFIEGSNRYLKRQEAFAMLPGTQIAYWIPEQIYDAFSCEKEKRLDFFTRSGLTTGNNDLFLKLWFEINREHMYLSKQKENVVPAWYPHLKGGEYRKWYGDYDYVIHYDSTSLEKMKKCPGFRHDGREFFFRKSITWSKTTAGPLSARINYDNTTFNTAGCCLFAPEGFENYAMALMNSKVGTLILSFLCPSLSYAPGDVMKLPVLLSDKLNIVANLADECINIAREDWDSFEVSWDFQSHPLLDGESLEDAFAKWEATSIRRFNTLKENEEKINKIFIELYGLKGRLSPEIEEREIAIRKANFTRDIKGFLSFAVGCMFGRYALTDPKGIRFAGGQWNGSEYFDFIPDKDNVIPITDEAYLEDDIVERLCEFIKIAFPNSDLEKNLDYIAQALNNNGETSREIIRNYFLNEFFSDHCSIYSVSSSGKRPIYWLFDSGKQNGFKALIYLHRYNADTIGNLRIDYLHRMQRIYESEIGRMQDMIDHSTNAREVAQATKRREKLTKQLKECREYDEKLAHLALSRIELDLDDGVKVNYRKVQTANDGKFYEVLADSKNIMAKK